MSWIGQYTSFTYLLANGRLILKAVIERPFSDRQAPTQSGPSDPVIQTVATVRAVFQLNSPSSHAIAPFT